MLSSWCIWKTSKEEFLCCSELKTITKSVDFMKKIAAFFNSEELQWENLFRVCTDGAPAMLSSQ